MLRRIIYEQLDVFAAVARWLVVLAPLGAAVGTACALFLSTLEWATELRQQHGGLLYLLPLAGALSTVLYRRFGEGAGGGNNLIIDEIHEPGAGGVGVPARLTPLVFVGSVVTHLFGGSAGREGTAVQMGGSLASLYSRVAPRWLGIDTPADRRTLLMSGVAAGFGGIFGTPIAGAVFALEVPALGRMSYAAAIPCLIAAVTADRACAFWGIHHTRYPQLTLIGGQDLPGGAGFDSLLLAKVLIAGAIFGLVSRLFSELAHAIADGFKIVVGSPILRPVFGGLMVIAMVYVAGTRDYLGLGVTSPDVHAVTIVSAFRVDGAQTWSWLWKILFTTVTLGASFKGGEVTPLFFIGATLGNTLSHLLAAPTALLAALGFASVFAGATNTPLACTIMAVELFGPDNILYFAAACFMAYACSGHFGIYLSQRIASPKTQNSEFPSESTLGALLQSTKEAAAHDGATTTARRLTPAPGGSTMVIARKKHSIRGREMGQLRIYLTARVKGRRPEGWKRILGSRPLFIEIIAAAKEAGILHAASHHSHHGYSSGQAIQSDNSETPNSNLTLYVELIDERARLEAFCRDHGELLKGRVIVFKHVERWDLHDNVLEEVDATVQELEGTSDDE